MAAENTRNIVAETEFTVPTMSSEASADAVLAALELVPGVRDATARMRKKRVSVRYEPGRVGEQQLKHALTQAGYPVVA